jgi:hypothetical protein
MEFGRHSIKIQKQRVDSLAHITITQPSKLQALPSTPAPPTTTTTKMSVQVQQPPSSFSLFASGVERMPMPMTLPSSTEVTSEDRSNEMRWIWSACQRFRHGAAVTFLAIRNLDRFLIAKDFKMVKTELRATSIAALVLADKYCEDIRYKVRCYVEFAGGADFLLFQTLQAERQMLDALNYDFSGETIANYLDGDICSKDWFKTERNSRLIQFCIEDDGTAIDSPKDLVALASC